MAKQPNGLELSILNVGNHLRGLNGYNGWTILKSNDGWWLHTKANDGNILIPSNVRVEFD